MLSLVRSSVAAALPEGLREREFAYLDAQGVCYLDYTGAALPARSQLEAQQALVQATVFGNPHSMHAPSRRSTDAIEAARASVLRFLDADPDEYVVIFTANTSAAVKLVAESFPFGPGSTLVMSQDNHNSVNGAREYALRRRSRVRYIGLDGELRLSHPRAMLPDARRRGPSLFAFPAQSNFSGVKHPLSLAAEAQRLRYRVLVDAAAYLPSTSLSLRAVRPDFVVMSFYKLFGFPAGVGGLVARREAIAELDRPWFAGGTVDWVSTLHRAHRLRGDAGAFEDGTANFTGIAALGPGLALLESIGMTAVTEHVGALTALALRLLRARRHRNGHPIFRIYGPLNMVRRGGTLAFNVLNAGGRVVHYEDIERHAAANGVAIRGGCFCNPGASEAAFGFTTPSLKRCLESNRAIEFSPSRLRGCLGGDVPVGALRISVGIANTAADIERAVDVIAAAVGA